MSISLSDLPQKAREQAIAKLAIEEARRQGRIAPANITGSIRYIIYGSPVTKKNSSQILVNNNTGKRFVAPSKAYHEYEKTAGDYLVPLPSKPIDSRVNVKCVYYMPTKRRVDLANLISATCDILTHYGVLDDDNSNIVVSHDGSRVRYDKDNPRAEITITEVQDI